MKSVIVIPRVAPPPGAGPTPMQRQADAFLDHLRARKLSAATVQARRNALRNFMAFLAANGVERFQDVDADRFERYRLELKDRHYAINTVEGYLWAVRIFFDWLEDHCLIFNNPARDNPIRTTPPPLVQAISVGQVNALLNSVDVTTPVGLRDRAILETFYAAGIRRAELVGLSVFDVNATDQTIRVLGKGRKERVLPLGGPATVAIRRYLDDGRPRLLAPDQPVTDALWLNHRGGAPLQIHMVNVIVGRHARTAGLVNVTSHVLRRSMATHILHNGAHPLFVANMLGHSDLHSLSHYLKVAIADLHHTHRRSRPGK